MSQETRSRSRHRRGSDIDGATALDLATAQAENVFLFVPNLIGYSRVILAAAALYYINSHPRWCMSLYALSCLLDALDGQAARALGQSSKFGAVLDMVTDRCTTSCLLCWLAARYPSYALVFQFLISLDFSSHYMHMYSSLVTGSESHKAVSKQVSSILWYYYNDPKTLFFYCAGNELFFISLYLIAKIENPQAFNLLLWRLTWPQLLAWATGPICFMKNVFNVVQLWKASKMLVGVDLNERAKQRAAKIMAEHNRNE